MPTSNDKSLLADNNVTNNSDKHTSIVELLSTPPLLPRTNATQQQLNTSSNDLTRSRTNDSSSSSISNVSLLSKSDSQTSLNSLPMIQQTPSQGLYSVHTTKWQHIKLSQLIESNKLIKIQSSIDIEQAFNTLIQYHLSSLPVQTTANDRGNYLTFDYNDLNFYLLLVLNKITIKDTELIQLCQDGRNVPVGKLIKQSPKDPFCKLSELDNLSNAINILGSGVHRLAITDPSMNIIKGILSQRRLVKYLWDNARSFPDLEPLFNSSIKDLNIGVLNVGVSSPIMNNNNNSKSRVISINGNQPLIDALLKMCNEKISSIAVVDNQYNLIGNISVTDVKHVTRTSQYPLLNNTCRHFISVILNTRGLENGGKDSFPIFHVYPTSSLARTIAKLVATQSHRLWIVQKPSTTTTTTTTSTTTPAKTTAASLLEKMKKPLVGNSMLTKTTSNSSNSVSSFDPAKSMTYLEKDHLAGKLIGVVSLTDILTALARNQAHNKQLDPQFARKHRSIQTK